MCSMASANLQAPNVIPDMLHPSFWLDRAAAPDAPLLSPAQRETFNREVYTHLDMPPVMDLPATLPASMVREHIASYRVPSAPRYGGDGALLTTAYFERLVHAASPDLPDTVPVRWGLVTRRTDVRAFPTADVITSAPYDVHLDRIQESTVDVGWPVAALAPSRGGQWWFGLTPLYWGWFRAEHIAFGLRDVIARYLASEPFAIVTASRALVATETGGGATPQMGTRLPLLDADDHRLRVQLPARAADGTLAFVTGHVRAASGELASGYRPCTLRTVIEQGFRLLGETYTWGGSRLGMFGRDCSRLLRDMFAVGGVLLPRNGDQQGQVCTLRTHFSPEMSPADRQRALLEHGTPGAILVLPGHVMLYLGAYEGRPYALHDTIAPPYNCVIVSDLSLGEGTESGSLLERLTDVVTIN